jgi:hypothetical protein
MIYWAFPFFSKIFFTSTLLTGTVKISVERRGHIHTSPKHRPKYFFILSYAFNSILRTFAHFLRFFFTDHFPHVHAHKHSHYNSKTQYPNIFNKQFTYQCPSFTYSESFNCSRRSNAADSFIFACAAADPALRRRLCVTSTSTSEDWTSPWRRSCAALRILTSVWHFSMSSGPMVLLRV